MYSKNSLSFSSYVTFSNKYVLFCSHGKGTFSGSQWTVVVVNMFEEPSMLHHDETSLMSRMRHLFMDFFMMRHLFMDLVICL